MGHLAKCLSLQGGAFSHMSISLAMCLYLQGGAFSYVSISAVWGINQMIKNLKLKTHHFFITPSGIFEILYVYFHRL
jgi:hypothetical protein